MRETSTLGSFRYRLKAWVTAARTSSRLIPLTSTGPTRGSWMFPAPSTGEPVVPPIALLTRSTPELLPITWDPSSGCPKTLTLRTSPGPTWYSAAGANAGTLPVLGTSRAGGAEAQPIKRSAQNPWRGRSRDMCWDHTNLAGSGASPALHAQTLAAVEALLKRGDELVKLQAKKEDEGAGLLLRGQRALEWRLFFACRATL